MNSKPIYDICIIRGSTYTESFRLTEIIGGVSTVVDLSMPGVSDVEFTLLNIADNTVVHMANFASGVSVEELTGTITVVIPTTVTETLVLTGIDPNYYYKLELIQPPAPEVAAINVQTQILGGNATIRRF